MFISQCCVWNCYWYAIQTQQLPIHLHPLLTISTQFKVIHRDTQLHLSYTTSSPHKKKSTFTKYHKSSWHRVSHWNCKTSDCVTVTAWKSGCHGINMIFLVASFVDVGSVFIYASVIFQEIFCKKVSYVNLCGLLHFCICNTYMYVYDVCMFQQMVIVFVCV